MKSPGVGSLWAVMLLALLLATIGGCAATSDSAVAPAGVVTEPSGPSGGAAKRSESLAVSLRQAGMTCSRAANASFNAIRQLGYAIVDFERPHDSLPGRIVAVLEEGWTPAAPEQGRSYSATIVVDCTDAGAKVEVSTSLGGFRRIRFPGEFRTAFRKHATLQQARLRRRPRAEPERGLSLRLRPVSAEGCVSRFGLDPTSKGVVVFSLEVHNRTERSYHIDPASVRLLTVEGRRTGPLESATVASRLGVTLEVTERVLSATMVAGEIGPGARHEGLLYFDASTYRRATVQVTDVDSGEAEGVTIRF